MTDPRVRHLISRYDAGAETYRNWWAPELIRMSLVLLDHMPETLCDRVLDVGSGLGNLIPHLQDRYRGAMIVGFDRSPGMLKLCPRDQRVLLMDAEELAFASGTFDAAVLSFVLFHLSDPARCLAEVCRVLRTGGAAGSLTWVQEPETEQAVILGEELDRHGAPPDPSEGLTRHEPVGSPEKMHAFMKEAGFSRINAQELSFAYRSSMDQFMNLKTGLGAMRSRLDQLDADTRARCLDAAMNRLARLPESAFEGTHQVVMTTAVRVGG